MGKNRYKDFLINLFNLSFIFLCLIQENYKEKYLRKIARRRKKTGTNLILNKELKQLKEAFVV